MDNKKYIDKVLDHLVKGTKMDYENGRVSTPYQSSIFTLSHFSYNLHFFRFSDRIFSFFSTYCKNTFGLTNDEIDYVWEMYKDIIKDKIKNGQ